jgi:hypothetical protein
MATTTPVIGSDQHPPMPPPMPPPIVMPQSGKYEYLLQQVVQLNTDLHKTVALSQSMKAERDAWKERSEKVCIDKGCICMYIYML